MHGLQRIKQKFPSIEVIGACWTFGKWANRVVEAREEAKRLHDYFVNQLKISFPVAVWMEPRLPEEDGSGGRTVAHWPGPINRDYPVLGKPTIWILDGKGRVRQILP